MDMSPEAQAERLIEQGYFQVSRQHRRLARLPDGEMPRDALFRASRQHNGQWHRRSPYEVSQKKAAQQYLRVFGSKEGNVIEVDDDVFQAFRDLGGRPPRGERLIEEIRRRDTSDDESGTSLSFDDDTRTPCMSDDRRQRAYAEYRESFAPPEVWGFRWSVDPETEVEVFRGEERVWRGPANELAQANLDVQLQFRPTGLPAVIRPAGGDRFVIVEADADDGSSA